MRRTLYKNETNSDSLIILVNDNVEITYMSIFDERTESDSVTCKFERRRFFAALSNLAATGTCSAKGVGCAMRIQKLPLQGVIFHLRTDIPAKMFSFPIADFDLTKLV